MILAIEIDIIKLFVDDIICPLIIYFTVFTNVKYIAKIILKYSVIPVVTSIIVYSKLAMLVDTKMLYLNIIYNY
jgi:hypothetical protein